MKGRLSCRHGVLFVQMPENGFKCMASENLALDWVHARFMPALDENLKIIVAKPFKYEQYRRLAVLQAEARRRSW